MALTHAVLEYTYGDDYLEAREEYRAAHLEVAWAAVDRGDLVLGGALGEGPYSGLLVFAGDDAVKLAQNFAEVDPYVVGGVVREWVARPWTTVVGQGAATPVRP
ncbi:YciI-like protein [Leifsonia poae]|uniref:YciI-like protein n=1 Tax=Leifsonia poae TaxID=110933 RepID=UPI003D66582E